MSQPATATQTTLEEQTNKANQTQNQAQVPDQSQQTDPAQQGLEQTEANPELEALRAELEGYRQKEIAEQQKGMSEDQKEIELLKNQMRDFAMKPILESKYFKEQELKDYTHEQLKAMNDLLGKLGKQGQPSRGASTPTKPAKKETVGIWKNTKTGEWE